MTIIRQNLHFSLIITTTTTFTTTVTSTTLSVYFLQSSVHPLVPLLLYSDRYVPPSSPFIQPVMSPATLQPDTRSRMHPCHHGNSVTRWVCWWSSGKAVVTLSTVSVTSSLQPSHLILMLQLVLLLLPTSIWNLLQYKDQLLVTTSTAVVVTCTKSTATFTSKHYNYCYHYYF